MEMALHSRSPLYGTHFGIKLAFQSSKSLYRFQQFRKLQISPCISARSGNNKGRSIKGDVSSTGGLSPVKGFDGKREVETKPHNKRKKNIAEQITAKTDLQTNSSGDAIKSSVGVLNEEIDYNDANRTSDDKTSMRKSLAFNNDQAHEDDVINMSQVNLSLVKSVESNELIYKEDETDNAEEKYVNFDETEKVLAKEDKHMDEAVKKKNLELLAHENTDNGNKVFVFPAVVKSGEEIEVFLNRPLSKLISENEVYIKGAYNDWKYKPFVERMHKTDIKGDWWSCYLRVPIEAYKIDFVFFNGENMYENNSYGDFFINVESSFDELAFEAFMIEEKRKELERLAKEQALKEREAEEQRKRDEIKAEQEADMAQAKMEVQKKREAINRVRKFAAKYVDDLWYIEPSIFKGKDKVKICYKRTGRPLGNANEIWIHGGHNNWCEGLTIVEKFKKIEERGGDWWYAEVEIPEGSLIIDWVFTNGPPNDATLYDNNNRNDFHATVPIDVSEELFWLDEEQRAYKALRDDRKLREKHEEMKAEKTALMKLETKRRSMKRFLLSQKNIVYTDPIEIRAGKIVKIFYNPSSTVLNGKLEVWCRCSFNHWTHHQGPLPPQKMVQAKDGIHLEMTVKVPIDAYMVDFVFSEREDGGIYDNKNRLDYHIPVIGGTMNEPPLHIVHVAVEMAPVAKVGGLGDVVTSLSRAVQELGHKVDIIFPKYDCMNISMVKGLRLYKSFLWGGTEIKVWFGKVEGLSVYFLEPQNGLFWVGCIYGRNDAERFGFFCHAALEFLLQSGVHPDILHCHDWSSAPVSWLYKEQYRQYGMNNARVIFTVHNLEFGVGHIAKAMQNADKATTVSSTYSKEVSGNSAIAPHLCKFHGILNGIDPDIWDPFNDKFIPVNYTSENVTEGKKAAKGTLQQRLGLREIDVPLVGIVTRLTAQKGIHLIKHAIWRTLECSGQVVLLGSAPDPRIQNEFVNLANQLHSSHADRARLVLTYDEPLSHLIYAASDFILVPSIFEPCGLTQLVAMRYGAIPVVRKTGGLYDTVFDVDNDKERAQAQGIEPNGFNFEVADAAGIDYALNRAISAWYNSREWFDALCKHVMEQDWSWNRPALDYLELYHAARKQ